MTTVERVQKVPVTREPEIRRVPEVVTLLGVDRKTVYEAVARNEIPHRRIGTGHRHVMQHPSP